MKKWMLLVLPLLLLTACNQSKDEVNEPPSTVEETTEMEGEMPEETEVETSSSSENQGDQQEVEVHSEDDIEDLQELFFDVGVTTTIKNSSIPLDEILPGGPPKDGIPAILAPNFDTVEVASEWLGDNDLGIAFKEGEEVRFYPYDILYWHEIANDVVGDKNIAVTFCPLCGSAIVFDRKEDVFGVSGLLWSSNLLMYDKSTETLWSQILGEAVIGDRSGETLEILPSDTLTFGQFKGSYPEAMVLNRDTGESRRYGQSPYGNYEDTNNDNLYFPVDGLESDAAKAFARKELFVASAAFPNRTIGFMRADLLEAGEASLQVDGITIEARVLDDGTIEIKRTDSDESLSHFVTMWFSLFAHLGGEEKVVVWP